MTHVSKKKIDQNTRKLLSELLNNLYINLDSKQAVSITNTLLTDTEIEMLQKRIGVILLTEQGVSNTNISGKLKVTHQTIERIQTYLMLVPKKDKNVLVSKLQKGFNKKLLKDLFSSLKSMDITRSNFKKRISPF